MEKQVHIIPQKVEEGQQYDPRLNSLVLKKAGSFTITIKEIEDLKKQKPLVPKPITELSEEEYNKLNKTGRWNYDVDVHQYNIDIKKYSEKLKLYKERLKKFDDLNWAWELVYNGLDPDKITPNVGFKKGIHNRFPFPELLEGGGIAWLEAWHEQEKPKGIAPFGMYVQAEGVPRIVRTEWTDCMYNTINETTAVAFGSKIILHIYTAGLYGQEVEVHLVDRDIFTPNDKLNISGEDFFTREVKVHKLKPNDSNKKGTSGVLTIDNTQVNYAQKIELEVILDSTWRKTAGDNLKIFPIVKSIKTGAFFTDFGRSYLQVSTDKKSITLDQEPIPATNMPLIIGNVETNIGAFDHCQYTAIELEYEKEKKTATVEIFKENPSVIYNPDVEIGLILGSVPKKFSIKVDKDSNTDECKYEDKPEDHGKNIFTYDKAKLPSNVRILNQTPAKIDFESWFDYSVFDNSEWALKYIWPTKNLIDSKIKTLEITADTCRHHHDINITVFPDIKWELAFMFALKNPLAYTYSAGKDNKDAEDKAKRDLIYADAHKKAYNSGNDRNKLRQGKEIDSEFFLTLKGKFNKVENSYPTRYENEQEYGAKFAQKISDFLDILAKLKNIANNAKDAAGGAARNPKNKLGNAVDNDPFSFEILSPKVGGVIQWEAEQIKEGQHKGAICTTGTLKLVADPLIGAEFTVNMLAVASKMNPIVYTIKKGIDIGLDVLGGYMKLDLKFYGALNITIETLKINSLEGVKFTDKPAKIDGKMGVELTFKLYASGKIEAWGCDVQLSFSAEAYAHAYFGGTAVIKSDSKGIYADIEGKFSGLLFSAKFEIKVGRYFKKVTINNEIILPHEIYPLGVYYLT